MTNLSIRKLTNTPVELIHKAFNDAFSDYEVKIQMPLEKFREMIITRDLNPEYSVGCFNRNKLVGFIMCGFREINGKNYCYDGGTGVIKGYQRKGIGKMMLRKLIDIFKENHINHFILEVLENNIPAIKLYEKQGFRKIRKLECFEIKKELLPATTNKNLRISNDILFFDNIKHADYTLYPPSWQNDFKSIQNAILNYSFASLANNNEILAFGFIHKYKGDIPQIGILDKWKSKELEKILIGNLAQLTTNKRITILNVESQNYLGEQLRNMGFENTVNQFEMILNL